MCVCIFFGIYSTEFTGNLRMIYLYFIISYYKCDIKNQGSKSLAAAAHRGTNECSTHNKNEFTIKFHHRCEILCGQCFLFAILYVCDINYSNGSDHRVDCQYLSTFVGLNIASRHKQKKDTHTHHINHINECACVAFVYCQF